MTNIDNVNVHTPAYVRTIGKLQELDIIECDVFFDYPKNKPEEGQYRVVYLVMLNSTQTVLTIYPTNEVDLMALPCTVGNMVTMYEQDGNVSTPVHKFEFR